MFNLCLHVFLLRILSKLQNNILLSAYIKSLKMLLTVGESLMYIKNNRGAMAEPCGAPVAMGSFFYQFLSNQHTEIFSRDIESLSQKDQLRCL